jgi:hypothetical protein
MAGKQSGKIRYERGAEGLVGYLEGPGAVENSGVPMAFGSAFTAILVMFSIAGIWQHKVHAQFVEHRTRGSIL